jgi:hypothetical protein
MCKLLFEIRHFVIRLWEILYFPQDHKSSVHCDFWLVCHSKDWSTVKLTIASIRKFSLNQPRNIYLVSNKIKSPNWLSRDIIYIYELDIPGIHDIYRSLKNLTYRGWILQQLLKYSGYIYSDRFVVIDCDTILLKPHLFFTNEGNPILRISYEYSPFYLKVEKAIGINLKSWFSYTAHMMPYESKHINNLIKQIEKTTKSNWLSFFANFSVVNGMLMNEQEIYAKFLLANKIKVQFRPWYNKTAKLFKGDSIKRLIYENKTRNSISFHKHVNKRIVFEDANKA